MTQGQIINIMPQCTSLPDSGDRYGRDQTLFIIIISHQETPEHSSGQILVSFYYYPIPEPSSRHIQVGDISRGTYATHSGAV